MNFSLGHLIFALTFYSIKTATAANQISVPSTLLRISTAHFAPYMYQDNDSNFYYGIEHSLVQMISNELNMGLSFQTAAKRSDICNNVILKWDSKYFKKNWKFNYKRNVGFIHSISDICIGGIFPEANLWKHTAISFTYLSDDLTWCVRKASIIPKFLSLALIFSPEGWFVCFEYFGCFNDFYSQHPEKMSYLQ